MTREEAKDLFTDRFCGDEMVTNIWVELQDIVDEIYDSYESRSCNNCRYYISESVITVSKCMKNILLHPMPKGDELCHKWEAKDAK